MRKFLLHIFITKRDSINNLFLPPVTYGQGQMRLNDGTGIPPSVCKRKWNKSTVGTQGLQIYVDSHWVSSCTLANTQGQV